MTSRPLASPRGWLTPALLLAGVVPLLVLGVVSDIGIKGPSRGQGTGYAVGGYVVAVALTGLVSRLLKLILGWWRGGAAKWVLINAASAGLLTAALARRLGGAPGLPAVFGQSKDALIAAGAAFLLYPQLLWLASDLVRARSSRAASTGTPEG